MAASSITATTSEAARNVEVDVLVVGGGVTGLTISALLADLGVRTLTVAKHRGTAPSPRAHITNQRTMEVFRDMGIEQRVMEVSTPLKDLGNGVMATSLTGLEVARYSCYGAGVDQLSDFTRASPTELVNAPQHVLERVLLARAQEAGCDIRYYNEVVHMEENPEGIVVRIRERTSQHEYVVRSRYLVAADGGRSFVAQSLGFSFEGQHGLLNMLTMWLEVDLTEYVAHRPAGIYFLMQPGNSYWVGSGTCVTVQPWNEWLLNRQYDPADGEPDTSEESIIAHARKVLGIPEHLPIKVKDASKWEVNNVVAKTFQHNRVFLAGDAAHRHPPASGLGSNTCVQDAYNLAWKLALVVSGQAGEKLLDSYTQERQPIGKQVVTHAITCLENMSKVPQTLGFRKGQTVEDGFASLEHLFSDKPGAEERRAELEEVVRLQDRRSNPLGVQLGHRYATSCAVYNDGTDFPEHQRDPVLYYEPTTHPGGYLPHAFIEYQGRQISTLDTIPCGKFGLIIGIGGSPWVSAAETVSSELGVELLTYCIGYRCAYDDVLGHWRKLREVKDSGALLVRPDRHIAWRSITCPSDPKRALSQAFSSVLGRQPLHAAL